MIAALLALALVAAQADDPYADEAEPEAEHPPRVLVAVWGGSAIATGGDSAGHSSSLAGAEVAWAFDQLDVGVAGYEYRRLPDATREWSPVAMVRLTQRLDVRRNLQAAFTLGLGAGRVEHWEAWYQIAFGFRAGSGPLFVAGEFGLEQLNQIRLAAGVGVRF